MLFPSWWIQLINDKLEGTGYELIVFRSYNEALIWDIFEKLLVLLLVLNIFVSVTFTINPAFSAIVALVGTIMCLRLWTPVISNQHPFENCWSYKE